MTAFPSAVALCHANYATGPASMLEFAKHKDELNLLRRIAAIYAGRKGWPMVKFEGHTVKAGYNAWTDFLMADFLLTHDPILIGEALLAIDLLPASPAASPRRKDK